MKLDWRIEYGVLKAAGCVANYEVSLGDRGWHAQAKYPVPATPRSWSGFVTEGALATGDGLAKYLDWCEKHDTMMLAGRSEECPAQPDANEDLAKEMPGGMSASKFPGTMDAKDWCLGAAKDVGADLTRAKVLREWFQAALSFAYVRGSEETLEKQKLSERPNHVPGPKPGWQASFDAKVWAKEFVRLGFVNPACADPEGLMIGWFANALMRGYDEHRWKTEGLRT